MNKNNYKEATNVYSRKLTMLYKSMLVGFFVGIVVVAYRLMLLNAENLSFKIYDFLRENLRFLPAGFVILGLFGYLVGLLVSKYTMISGSGIPQVKGIMMGYFKCSWISTLIAKFIGGAISILGGLSLGREGPSVQLGACVAEGIGQKLANSRTEKKVLIASGASAGLAAAFNAPLAGTMFAMEEIFKYFSPIILLSTMASAMVADFISKMVFGISPVFNFDITSSIPLSGYWLLCILGIALGIFGAIYNSILLKTQKLYKSAKWLNAKTQTIIPFLFAGVFGIIFPVVLGGGHRVIEELQLSTSILFILLIFVVKFVFSMISFGSGAPGGIFFPLLIIGATIGAMFGNVAVNYFGFDAVLFYNFIILAMAGYFTAIVRAPITGIILLVEMTGSFTHLLSLTVVCIVAYITADLLNSAPIYESLLENQIADKKSNTGACDEGKKITMEMVVHYGSPVEKKLVKDIDIPKNSLLIAIRRLGNDITPNGDTQILAEDYLVFITDLSTETSTRELLEKITSAE
ncbi:MAG: chloride channel protein [Proteocatella sp.]